MIGTAATKSDQAAVQALLAYTEDLNKSLKAKENELKLMQFDFYEEMICAGPLLLR